MLLALVLHIFAQLVSAMDLSINNKSDCRKLSGLDISCVKGRVSKVSGLYCETLDQALLKRFQITDDAFTDKTSDPHIIVATKYLRYTRFNGKNFEDEIALFIECKKAIPEVTVGSLLDRKADLGPKKQLIKDILQLCSIVLPEDNSNRNIFVLIEKKRALLKELFESSTDALEIIATDEVLAQNAYEMVKKHIFFNLVPFKYDGDDEDSPNEIKESAYETLRWMYALLSKFLDVQSDKVAAYKMIEADEELPIKLFMLLKVPDIDERNQAVLAITKLFGYHSKYAELIAKLISERFAYLSNVDSDFHFFYNDVIATFRLCLMIFFEHEYPNEKSLGARLSSIFHYQFVPLLRLNSISSFSSQWTFLFENAAEYFPIEEVLDSFRDNLFITTGLPNHSRDSHLCTIYNDIYLEVKIPDDRIPSYIGFIFEAAAQYRIRPRLIEDALDVFIGEESHIYADFNMINGTKGVKLDLCIKVYATLSISLRRLYLAFHRASLEITNYLVDMIELWDLTDTMKSLMQMNAKKYGDFLIDYDTVDFEYRSALNY